MPPPLEDRRLEMHPAKDIMKSASTRRLLQLFDCMDIKDRGRVSEDLSFCMRWNQIGGEVWAAIGHYISHVGPHDFRARYLDNIEAEAAQEALAAAAMGVPQSNVIAAPPAWSPPHPARVQSAA
ncbi:MAG TPA: hypothetical protein VKB89_00545 [Xanthobacteraceae bacterium]|nr:hypothetical protein [Xanthobacteraceae bacterium]